MRSEEPLPSTDVFKVAIMFVLPFMIAIPLLALEDKIFGSSREILFEKERITIEGSILVGLIGLWWARRDWPGRIAFSLIYLAITVVVFVYWGLYSRGYFFRFNPVSDFVRWYL